MWAVGQKLRFKQSRQIKRESLVNDVIRSSSHCVGADFDNKGHGIGPSHKCLVTTIFRRSTVSKDSCDYNGHTPLQFDGPCEYFSKASS